MSASFYDLLKYAKTGLASPGMTSYDKMRALSMTGGGAIKTLTGVPPLSFKSNGKPLISWSMSGNSQQNGTPAPDAPIMPEFVGEKTENLFDYVAYFSSAFTKYSTYFDYADVQLAPNTTYTFSTNFIEGENPIAHIQETPFIVMSGDMTPTTAAGGLGNKTTRTLTTDSSGVVRVYKRIVTSSQAQIPTLSDFQNGNWVMCNVGSTPLPYEPYGYKLPITNAGQTQNVYLGEVQTTRKIKKLVLDGTENWVMSAAWEKPNTVVYFFELAGINTAGGTSTAWIYSDRFPAKSRDDMYNADYNCIARTGSIAITVRVNKSTAPTMDDFKAWLSQQSAAGTPVVIWYVLATPKTGIVNEPLCKIGDYADTLDSADAGITIPTTRGSNTLTVDTDLPPSSMTITYR